MRNRGVALVVRNKKILMNKTFYYGRYFYALPGGGVESGETPEQAAIRELKEECALDGEIVRKIAEVFRADGSTEYVFAVKVPDGQEPVAGYNPEEAEGEQSIKGVEWKELCELSEKDRAFLWAYGLLEIDGFFDEVIGWGDEVSYPAAGGRE